MKLARFGMEIISQTVISRLEYLKLYRRYEAYKSFAEDLCRKYGIEARMVVFTF